MDASSNVTSYTNSSEMDLTKDTTYYIMTYNNIELKYVSFTAGAKSYNPYEAKVNNSTNFFYYDDATGEVVTTAPENWTVAGKGVEFTVTPNDDEIEKITITNNNTDEKTKDLTCDTHLTGNGTVYFYAIATTTKGSETNIVSQNQWSINATVVE